MTRFARASGSKGCNEKRPEEASSWVEMKSQMLKKNSKEVLDNCDYDKNSLDIDVEEIKSVWAELTANTMEESDNNNEKDVIESRKEKKVKKKKLNKSEVFEDKEQLVGDNVDVSKGIKKKHKVNASNFDSDCAVGFKKIKKRKLETICEPNDSDINNFVAKKKVKKMVEKEKLDVDEKKLKKLNLKGDDYKLNKKKKHNISVDINVEDVQEIKMDISKEKKKKKNIKPELDIDANEQFTKKKKNLTKKNDGKYIDDNVEGTGKKKEKKIKNKSKLESNIVSQSGKDKKKKKKIRSEQSMHGGNEPINFAPEKAATNEDINKGANIAKKNKKDGNKLKKPSDNQNKANNWRNDQVPREKQRRKAELEPTEIVINGRNVKISPFDGFMVLAEDAERLKELRKNMTSKGIGRAEREKAIKLERRRAEKALQRLRKQVCFLCRNSGHVLSECPKVDEDQAQARICYKCGSTEHTHFQCKVNRGQDFRFAECFICKEQGHIAKQCPDNPRGLYPRGGGCALCGDVTHLRKDCPKHVAQQQEASFVVGTRDDRALEAIDEDFEAKSSKARPIQKKKHILFD